MGPDQLLLLNLKGNPGVMITKEYSTIPRAPEDVPIGLTLL